MTCSQVLFYQRCEVAPILKLQRHLTWTCSKDVAANSTAIPSHPVILHSLMLALHSRRTGVQEERYLPGARQHMAEEWGVGAFSRHLQTTKSPAVPRRTN